MSKLEEILDAITPLDYSIEQEIQAHLDNLTKPPGSLGRLEELAKHLALIKENISFSIDKKVIFVLAADHGVAVEGVSAFPKEVTAQMVLNFLNNGAAINVLANHYGAKVVVVDMGVDFDFGDITGLVNMKVNRGTKNFFYEPAMSREEAIKAIENGIQLFETEKQSRGIDIVGIGEMGIANTAASSAITAVITGSDPREVTGRGTGIDDQRLSKKIEVIKQAINKLAPDRKDPIDVLAKVGGFEIGGMVGIILSAAAYKVPVVIDGFISSASALLAFEINPNVKYYLIPSHKSVERGHEKILRYLGLNPYLDLNMRLGEGTGAAIMMGLAESSRKILTEMATFQSAGVSNKE